MSVPIRLHSMVLLLLAAKLIPAKKSLMARPRIVLPLPLKEISTADSLPDSWLPSSSTARAGGQAAQLASGSVVPSRMTGSVMAGRAAVVG